MYNIYIYIDTENLYIYIGDPYIVGVRNEKVENIY